MADFRSIILTNQPTAIAREERKRSFQRYNSIELCDTSGAGNGCAGTAIVLSENKQERSYFPAINRLERDDEKGNYRSRF